MIPLPLPMIWGTYMKLVTKYRISAINSCWEKCAYMFNVYKKQLSRQTGSRNLMVPKTLPTIWHTYVKLVTKYQISATNSCWEKCDEKYFGRTDGQRLNNIPPSPSGSGGIIRSKIGSKCVDLILIRLAKCWNNFFSSKFCIWLYCENGKYMIIPQALDVQWIKCRVNVEKK